MDQKRIGSFLKELRREKGITQEEFAEILNVSGRTVSRWETGSNMPDISLLVEIADFFGVSIPEIINGERKNETMEKEVKEVAEMLSDYAGAEKELLLGRVRNISIIGLFCLMLGTIMEEFLMYSSLPIYQSMRGVCWGVVAGSLMVMVMYTTGILAKIREKKPMWVKKMAVVCFAIMIVSMIAALVASVV